METREALTVGANLDIDRSAAEIGRYAARQVNPRNARRVGRLTGKAVKGGVRLTRQTTRAARTIVGGGSRVLTATATAAARVVLAAKVVTTSIVGAISVGGTILPIVVGIVAVVAALCAILPSFITGVGAEHQRRMQAVVCDASDAAAPVVTPEQVAAFLPVPQGVDRSASLTPEQRATAAVIVEVGMESSLPPRAWAIALMTALQESTLGADSSTTQPNSDGDVGVFQQRALVGWYADGATMEENVKILNDVRYAARTFYEGHDVKVTGPAPAGEPGYHIPGLMDIPGWETIGLGAAAQAVQVSAFPDAYTKHEATVAALLPTLSVECAAPAAGSSGLAGVDDYYPWWVSQGSPESGYDDNGAGFAWKQCTSYAAFAVRTYTTHKDFTNSWKQPRNQKFGDAKTWHTAAARAGIRVDQTPAVGAVAQRTSGRWGHVAFVVAVNSDGSFVINEYNRNGTREFGSRTARIGPGSNDFTNILHFEEPL